MIEVVGNEDFLEIINRLKQEKPFPHTLLYGPSGTGKTTIGRYISQEIKQKNIHSLYGPELDKFWLTMLFRDMTQDQVIMIDEIHGLKRGLLEILYQPMEEFTFQGRKIPRFTLIGITSELSDLKDALQRRFRLVYRVSLYTTEQLMEVIKGLVSKTQDDNVIQMISLMSRGSPGIARNHVEVIEQMFKRKKLEVTDIAEYQQLKHINMIGMEEVDLDYLRILAAYDAMSLKTISSMLSEREDTLEKNIEPYLFRIGMVVKTSKGRTLTPKGKLYIAKQDKEVVEEEE